MRGGTSKAAFFHKKDIPQDSDNLKSFLLDVMGSPDRNQIDGIGGANSLTSKVAIIEKSEREGIDIDYTFAQVSLENKVVDFKGNCGNISSAVAPFAIDEGVVKAAEPKAVVKIYNTNTEKIIEAEVQVENEKFKSDGMCFIPGVPNPGSEIFLSFYNPGGSVTGKILPTGNPVDNIQTTVGEIEISIVDAANPLVFIRAKDVGLRGIELPSQFSPKKLELLEEIRSIAADLCGFAKKENATQISPAVPKTTIISMPQDYKDLTGKYLKGRDMDLTIRMLSMQKPHQALALTGAVCTTIASNINGTLVADYINKKKGNLRLGHPGGIMETYANVIKDDIEYVKVVRTARRIMEGYVQTKASYSI